MGLAAEAAYTSSGVSAPHQRLPWRAGPGLPGRRTVGRDGRCRGVRRLIKIHLRRAGRGMLPGRRPKRGWRKAGRHMPPGRRAQRAPTGESMLWSGYNSSVLSAARAPVRGSGRLGVQRARGRGRSRAIRSTVRGRWLRGHGCLTRVTMMWTSCSNECL